jgi:hypothetical protein
MLSCTYRWLEGEWVYNVNVDGNHYDRFLFHNSDKLIFNNVEVGYLMKWNPFINNHPCTYWVRNDRYGYDYLINHLDALIKEYDLRFENKAYERERSILSYCKNNPINFLTYTNMKIPQAIKNYQHMDNPVEAYRNYYKQDKREFAKWSVRKVPNWFLK